MQENMIFVIGAPKSGVAILQRLLGMHKDIFSLQEPHIVVPLAHLGYYAKVEKAPFDHILAAQAIEEYVEALPNKAQDYYDACAAYLDVLYRTMIGQHQTTLMVDTTPDNAMVLPFLTQVYPRAKYIVLTRHPMAIFTSYANCYFDGDCDTALAFNNVLGRYVPAIADFLREKTVPFCHVRYEEMVLHPQEHIAEIFAFLGMPNLARDAIFETTHLDSAWITQLASDSHKLDLAKQIVAPLAQEDIALWGYDKAMLFDDVVLASGNTPTLNKKWNPNSNGLKRKLLKSLKKEIHNKPFGKVVKKVKYFCDVLLRE